MKRAKKKTCENRRSQTSTRITRRAGIPDPGRFGSNFFFAPAPAPAPDVDFSPAGPAAAAAAARAGIGFGVGLGLGVGLGVGPLARSRPPLTTVSPLSASIAGTRPTCPRHGIGRTSS